MSTSLLGALKTALVFVNESDELAATLSMLNVPFSSMPPEEDEAESSNDAGDVRVGIVPQEHVQAVALARAKAVAVRHTDALVFAVEQVCLRFARALFPCSAHHS